MVRNLNVILARWKKNTASNEKYKLRQRDEETNEQKNG